MSDKAQGAGAAIADDADECAAFMAWYRANTKNLTLGAWDAWRAGRNAIRAALKVQPAPTEAQGEDIARLDAEQGWDIDDLISNMGIKKELTVACAEDNLTIIPSILAVQNEDKARLDYLDTWVAEKKDDGWDTFHFSFDSSTSSAREQIDQDRARASAETGGVKS